MYSLPILIILIFVSAFFSATEIVYAKTNMLRLRKMAEAGNNKAKKAYDLALNYPALISTILIGNNLANIAASSLATVFFVSLFGEVNGPLYAGIVMTLALLIFSEIVPKIIFAKYATPFSLVLVKPIKICAVIFKPFVFIMTYIIDFLSPIWTRKKDEEEDTSGEELINMIETIEEKGLIDNETKELVTNAIELKDVTAHEIMTQRVDVIAFDIETPIDELLSNDDIFTYSRVLIYEDTVDKIIGILNTKKLIISKLSNQEIDLRSMLTKPIYVHKTKLLTSILKVFKETKTHIAVVVDEFGGTLGIITLEDVLEEVVGEIFDEMDEVYEEFIKTSDVEFIIDGDMNLYDMFELINFDCDDDFECAYSTVAGWCTEMLDDFPSENDTFTYENLEVTILKVNGFRVENVKVIIKELSEDDD